MAHSVENKSFCRRIVTILNGKWSFSCNNLDIKQHEIIVPFCVESKLSEIGYTGFVTECEYVKEFKVTKSLNKRLLLVFEGVDYECQVFINDKLVGSHIGGYTRFKFDITDFVNDGINKIKVLVKDDNRKHIASGKQSYKDDSFGCFYRRTTGIYNDVYIEEVGNHYISDLLITPFANEQKVNFNISTIGQDLLQIDVFYKNKLINHLTVDSFTGGDISLSLNEKHLWSINQGNLYDVVIKFGNDTVKSYFGLRDVYFKDQDFFVNEQKVFQMLVLDQGFYKDGIYTPKNDKEIIRDIKLALKLGFNGARLHQRVFPHKYLYYADKLGFMVWQEYGSWGLNNSNLDSYPQFEKEWVEVIKQNYNHPSIVCWCPLNEVWKDFTEEKKIRNIKYVENIYLKTKEIEKYRPVIDASGGYHSLKTDINDFHCYYEYDKLKEVLDKVNKNELNILSTIESPSILKDENIKLNGLPIILSEFGGMSVGNFAHNPNQSPWAYSNCNNVDKFVDTYVELVKLVKSCSILSGCCYTQLYDIEQERNGFYTFDRKPKLNKKQIKKIRNINKGGNLL